MMENSNNTINNDIMKGLKKFRNETVKYRDISDKDLIELIKYALEEIQTFGALGNNAPNMNDLPNNLSAYKNICPDLVKDVKKVFYKKKNNNNNNNN